MIEAIVSQVLASLIVGVFGQLSSPEHAALNQAIRRLALASRRDTGQEANEICVPRFHHHSGQARTLQLSQHFSTGLFSGGSSLTL